MTKYMILEILQTQAFDVIIAVCCIVPFYFLMKMFVKHELQSIKHMLNEILTELVER